MRFKKRPGILSVSPALVLLLFLFVMSAPVISQQYLNDQYSNVYAITNTKIVVGDGNIIENGTLLIKDGLISAVGDEVVIPEDAIVIDGTELTVYPGFIDAHTNLGFITKAGEGDNRRGRSAQTTEESKEPDPKNRKYDPNLRPDRIAADLIDLNDKKIKEARESGITAAVVVPKKGVFPGKGSLILTNGIDPVKSTLKRGTSQFLLYTPEQGGYPAMLFAVVSFQRQSFLDAQYYFDREKEYKKNPRAALNAMKKRLTYDPALKYLFPLLDHGEQVVINAEDEKDIKRAIDLAHFDNTLELNYVLSGVTEGYRLVDLLKNEKIPLIVSLDFPKPNRTTGFAFNLPIKPFEAPEAPGEKKKKNKDDDKSELEKKTEEQVHGNAASLYNAGIPFVLSSGGKYKDFVKNLRLAVKAGLSEDAALSKITREPAEMLGVDGFLGTVELGKVANLVVTDGNIFADTVNTKMVFVDGKQYEIKIPEKPKGDAGGITGEWDMLIITPGGPQEATMSLSQTGTTVTGTIVDPDMEIDIEDGHYENNTFTFTAEVQGMQISFSATVTGNSMEGTAEVEGFGEMEWSAEKPNSGK